MKKSKYYLPKFLRRFIVRQKYKKLQAEIQARPRSKTAHNPLIVLLNFVFMLAAFIIIGAAAVLYSVKFAYQRPGPTAVEQDVQIPAGSGAASIADLLESRGLIRSARIFSYGLHLGDKAGLLKAGEYKIPPRASMRDIADILVRGRPVQFSVTLPEGLTVAQIFTRLKEEPLLSGDLPVKLPPEGALMTDTVSFTRGTARTEIIRRLELGQARRVAEIWAGRAPDLPLKSAEEMVILASIVEKETGLAAERPRVAAVFYNRLKKHMRLQSDPTILYGLFGSEGRPADRPIYRSDLDSDTPYNTYKIFGLPPGPICNPGRDSLLAVAHPPQSNDLYFVADGTGGHIFAASLNEHNNNVQKWRALRKQRERTAAQTPPANSSADGRSGDNAPAAGSSAAGEKPQPKAADSQPALKPIGGSGSSAGAGGLVEEQP